MIQALNIAAEETGGSPKISSPHLAIGSAIEREGAVAFVFSGNGSQWPGMGREAFEANIAFRARFNAIDAIFEPLSGWSLVAMMFDPDIATHLSRTSIAQPLVFAI